VDDKEPFLSRWSRRKLAANENSPAALPPAELPAAAAAVPPAPAAEPRAPESPQDMSPEYREFFDPQVDEKLRQSALRGLFSDPHFNVMDGLDTYIDDYSIADPIPVAMLRQLNQAKELFLFDDEKKTAEGAGAAVTAGGAAAAAPVAAAETAELPAPSPTSASDEDAEAGTRAAAAAPARDGNNT